ncbi:hypothetical protein VTN96DRAFT_4209 [Rasamsonia emersonii]
MGFRYMIKTADPFVVECRAYDALIAKGLNGKATPYCYGWLSVDDTIEETLQKKPFWVPFAWDRPPESVTEPLHGLSLEYVDGVAVDNIQTQLLTPDIAESFRQGLRMIHTASVLHGDLKPANMMVTSHGQGKKKGVWIDLSVSIIPPLIVISEETHGDAQRTKTIVLEYFFSQLEKVCLAIPSIPYHTIHTLPENKDVVLTTADIPSLLGGPIPDRWFIKYGFKLMFYERGIDVNTIDGPKGD